MQYDGQSGKNSGREYWVRRMERLEGNVSSTQLVVSELRRLVTALSV